MTSKDEDSSSTIVVQDEAMRRANSASQLTIRLDRLAGRMEDKKQDLREKLASMQKQHEMEMTMELARFYLSSHLRSAAVPEASLNGAFSQLDAITQHISSYIPQITDDMQKIYTVQEEQNLSALNVDDGLRSTFAQAFKLFDFYCKRIRDVHTFILNNRKEFHDTLSRVAIEYEQKMNAARQELDKASYESFQNADGLLRSPLLAQLNSKVQSLSYFHYA